MKSTCWLSLTLLLSTSVVAQDQVSLGCAVPADVHFYIHGMTSQTPDPGWLQFEKALGHIVDSRVHEDILDLATMDMSPRAREEVKGGFQHMLGIITQVDWGLLAGREMVFAYKMATPLPEYLAVFRVPEDQMAAQRAGVKQMLTGFAQMAGLPADSVQEVERRTGSMTRFEIDLNAFKLEVACGAVGDVMVMSTSSRMLTSAMRRLKSGDSSRSLIGSERFQTSLAQLPKATEAVFYVDMHGLLDYVAKTMQLAKAGIQGSGQRATWSREVVDLIGAFFAEIDVVDHVMSTETSDGTTTTATALVQLASDFADTGLASTLKDQQSWNGWYQRVPADATSFGFDAGLDPLALMDLMLNRARENSENVDAMLAGEFARPLAMIRGALSHISGESCWVSFPTAGSEGCTAGESVCYIKLHKAEQVAQMLPRWLGGCQGYLQSRGQGMDVVSQDGLHEIRLAAFPWIRPVVGVRGDELIVATSPAALAKIARVAAGQEPDIRKSPRFAALGAGEADALDSLMYGQVDANMGGLANIMSAVGFFMALAPEERDTRELIKLGTILTKLAPALRELDSNYDWATEALPAKLPNAILTRTVYRHRNRAQ